MAKRTKRLTSQGEEFEDVRINKFLSEAGVCSRREADRYITEGKVKIDGVVAQMGSRVTKDSQVTFFDEPVHREEKLVLIAFNKPEGIVCTTDQNEPDNIIAYIDYGMRIYPIGRLDKDSEGLILLTNDGNIVNKILRAENRHEKEYIVTVNKEINQEFLKNMSSGVPILDTVTNPCTVTQIDKYTFNIILTQGLNRQIRRMCEQLGYRVVNLKRIRIMNITLGRLKTGDYRNVTEKEIEELNVSFTENKTDSQSKSSKSSITKNDKRRNELHSKTINSRIDKKADNKADKKADKNADKDAVKKVDNIANKKADYKSDYKVNKKSDYKSDYNSDYKADKKSDYKSNNKADNDKTSHYRKDTDERKVNTGKVNTGKDNNRSGGRGSEKDKSDFRKQDSFKSESSNYENGKSGGRRTENAGASDTRTKASNNRTRSTGGRTKSIDTRTKSATGYNGRSGGSSTSAKPTFGPDNKRGRKKR